MSAAEEEALLKEFFMDMKDVDRDNEVNRILGAFKLNPFEQIGINFDCTMEDIRRQYRKVSLMVHPDKCKHPRATDAFEVLGNANKTLSDEEHVRELRHALTLARDEVRKERTKALKKDVALRLAGMIHKEGKEGVQAEYEQSPEFHDAWKQKARDMLAKAEWRRRKLTKRLKDDEERIEDEEAENRKKLKSMREHHKNWEANRDGRVGTWRTFVDKKSKKKEGKSAAGGIKPPKLKTADEERTYIQRPVGEQFRPPPPPATHQRP
ncbi:hypothetical protein WJX84_002401 [Apatococcus fuscideae]